MVANSTASACHCSRKHCPAWRTIEQYQTAGSALGLSVQPVKVRSREEFEGAFDRIDDARAEGIVMPPAGLMGQSRTHRAVGADAPSSSHGGHSRVPGSRCAHVLW